MDDQVKAKLLVYLDSLENKLSDGVDFVVSEAPAVAQEWISYTFWWNLFGVCVLGFVALIGIAMMLLSFVFCRYATQQNKELDDIDVGTGVAGAIVFAFAFGLLCLPLHNVVKTVTAPRVVVIEKIKELSR